MQNFESSFLSAIWAIEPDWLKRAYSVIKDNPNFETKYEHDEKPMLAAIAGERPQGTRYTVIPENTKVAVIEIWGAIFPRANMMTYYSGGTSCELLTKDIKSALADVRIESILFLIHSPGGEVTGISEISDLIYKSRGKKPTTGYIHGYGCSGSYWIGSACGDVVVNKTANVGSIGVYSCYTDDTQKLKLLGLEEIEFRNEQSPNKNLSPTTEKGRNLIQTRINDLGAVFYADIARNRGMKVEDVIKNFGGGDTFIGAKAVKQGLADRIGSFDYAFGCLNGDNVLPDKIEDFEDDADDTDDTKNTSATIQNQNDVNSFQNQETEKSEDKTNGDFMADEKETKTSAEVKPATTETVKPETAKVEAAATDTSVTAEAFNALQEELKAMKSENTLRDLKDKFTAKAASFAGNKDEKINFLVSLAEKFGEDSTEVSSYITDQNAMAEQIRAGGLFKEIGSSAKSENDGAEEQLNAIAKDIAAKRNLTIENAYSIACSENPALYTQLRQQ
jgi:signal peptide peptidase SppA